MQVDKTNKRIFLNLDVWGARRRRRRRIRRKSQYFLIIPLTKL